MVETVDEFLSHFGTKGMKWGVRKARDAPDTFKSKAQLDKEAHNREIAKKVAIGAGVVVALGVSVYAGKQAYNYNKEASALAKRANQGFSGEVLSRYGKDKTQTFQKGFDFLRTSSVQETGMRGRTFASASAQNAEGYTGFGSWDMKIKAMKDITAPSTKERVDLLASTISRKELQERAASRANLGAKIAARFPNKKNLAAIKLDKITLDEWQSKDGKAFIDTLKTKGFSAVWDDWDKGSSYILFDEKAFKYSTPSLAR